MRYRHSRICAVTNTVMYATLLVLCHSRNVLAGIQCIDIETYRSPTKTFGDDCNLDGRLKPIIQLFRFFPLEY